MRGRFTRYGDVGALVAERDDRLVIMGAGDEMTVTFPVPPGPPAGPGSPVTRHVLSVGRGSVLFSQHIAGCSQVLGLWPRRRSGAAATLR